ncbi:MAG: dipeptide epimerase [Bacteroidetes bacterium]|nr:dipeptide epimerase [Bacteroidota bacterium]
MLHWQVEKIVLDLKYTWKISRNASDQKNNLIVRVSDGNSVGAGEAAPNVRYHESPDELLVQFARFLHQKPEEINSMQQLQEVWNASEYSHALRFAIESAYTHCECLKNGKTIFEILGVQPRLSIPTSYSIPIMDTGNMKRFYEDHLLKRFPYVKIKIDSESGMDAVDCLSRFCVQPIIVDANEAFRDVEDCIHFLEKIKKKQVEFIEQPLPSSMTEEAVYLKKHTPFRLFADESITADADFPELKKMFDGVNIKLMKAGAYWNAIRLLKLAKEHHLQTMVGCMVETTLGIASAMSVCSLADYADLDSFMLLEDDPFDLAEEKDGVLTFRNANEIFR